MPLVRVLWPMRLEGLLRPEEQGIGPALEASEFLVAQPPYYLASCPAERI